MGAASGLALTAGAMAATPAMAAEPTTAASGANQVEEVVVTAQKRSENLQAVPVSVTAVTARTLEGHRFELISDLNGLAPNVYLNAGLIGQGSIIATIRGLTSAPVFPGQSEGVPFYLDGVYLGNTYGDLLDLADVSQIEVLKGPQGTLFGRSSVGGAISINTKDPVGQFHVTETLSGGNYDQFRNKTHIEFPRMGPFTANFTYLHFQRTGDIKNLGGGTVWDLRQARASNPYYGTHANDVFTSSSTLGDQDVNAVMGTVKFQPTDDFSITYKGDYSRNDYTPYGDGLSFIGGPGNCVSFFTTTCLAQVIAAQPPGTPVPVANLTRPNAVNDNFDGPSYEINTGHALTFNYRINSIFTVKDIAAYRYNNSHFDANTSGDGGLLMEPGGVSPFFWLFYNPGPPYTVGPKSPAYGTPMVMPVSDNDYYSHQWTNELQFFANTKWFSLTSGWMIYVQEGKTWDLKQITFPNAAGTYITGAGTPSNPYVLPPCGNSDAYTSCTTPSPVPPGLAVGGFRTAAHSEALYSQGQFHVTPQIDLIGGIRESWDTSTQGGDGTLYGLSGPPHYQFAKDTRPTYRLGGQYKPTSDMMLYVTYSTGFIPGGTFNAIAYNPETATSYEGGIKADWLDHKLRTNLAVFDAQYVGFQQFSFAGGVLHVINANSATGYGFEFEGTVVPIEGLTLESDVGYTNYQYADHNNPVSATIPYFVPAWTLSFKGNYESSPLDWAMKGRFVVSGDAGYTSSIHLITGCTGSAPGCLSPAAYAATTVGPQWLLNGRMGITAIPVGQVFGNDTTIEVALWCRNLTDNKSLTQSTTQNRDGSWNAGWQPARTFGVDVTAKF